MTEIRIMEPKGQEGIVMFCNRLLKNKEKGKHAIGIYNGIILDSYMKEDLVGYYNNQRNKKVKKYIKTR